MLDELRTAGPAKIADRMTLQFELDWTEKLSPSAQLGMQQADENADTRWKRWVDGCIQHRRSGETGIHGGRRFGRTGKTAESARARTI